MSEWLVLAGVALAAVSGVHRNERLFTALLSGAALAAAAGAILALATGGGGELSAAWQVPGGHFVVGVDAISAMFVLQIALLALLGAWYGLGYWPQAGHPDNARKVRLFYGAVTAGMLLLVVARSALLFLAGWEIMALAAFILVSTEDDKPTAREVGFVYLLSTRAGTLCLFAMFALLGAAAGSLDFADFPRALASPLRDAIFALALVGFGLKAGIMPAHIWLPGAHANAPSHVSALMSGMVIKTGIYGLVRLTSLCDAPPMWWGYTVLALGVVSGILGVGFAIGQHDLKRLLAYHSVENIGIILLGLGVALLGRSTGSPVLVALGLAGALLHVWNHGLFKALLFLSAGSVLHATGTREIDRLGGLSRRMPATSLAFLVGAVAICGLPPLNGLVSEILVYLGLFRLGSAGSGPWLAGALAAPALALIGALAIACFVKVFGAVFLGEPRTVDGEHAHEAPASMLVPMAVLASGCVAIALGAPLVARVLDAAVRAWAGATKLAPPPLVDVAPLVWVSSIAAALIATLALAGTWLASRARARASSVEVGTWDCGYAAPTPRMQYTSSSFAGTIVGLLGWALRPSTHAPRLSGPFPAPARFESHVPDTVLDRVVVPAFSRAARLLLRLRPIQAGSIHLYILYVLAALLALLLWT